MGVILLRRGVYGDFRVFHSFFCFREYNILILFANNELNVYPKKILNN